MSGGRACPSGADYPTWCQPSPRSAPETLRRYRDLEVKPLASSSKRIPINLDANFEGAIRYVQSTGNRSVDHGFSLREFPHMSSGPRHSVHRDFPEFALSSRGRRVQRCSLPRPPPHSDHPPPGQFIPAGVAVNTPFEGCAHGAPEGHGASVRRRDRSRRRHAWARTRYLKTICAIARLPGVDSKPLVTTVEAWHTTIVGSGHQIKNVLKVTPLVTRAVVNWGVGRSCGPGPDRRGPLLEHLHGRRADGPAPSGEPAT